MDKYRPCPSIIAMFTSDSQHPPRSKHAVYLGDVVNTMGIILDNDNLAQKCPYLHLWGYHGTFH